MKNAGCRKNSSEFSYICKSRVILCFYIPILTFISASSAAEAEKGSINPSRKIRDANLEEI